MTAASAAVDPEWSALWRGRPSFAVLATGREAPSVLFGAWAAWQDDPRRCARLDLIGIVPEWSGAAEVGCTLAAESPAKTDDVHELMAVWPPCTPNLHAFDVDDGRVRWLLAPGRAADWLPRLTLAFDAAGIGSDASGWPPGTFKRLARLAARGARLRPPPLSDRANAELRSAGFTTERPALDGAMATARFDLRFDPRFVRRRPAGRVVRPALHGSRAVVVGAGLAGCACAWALAERGLRCTLLERRGTPAAEASGNPAGLFHGVVHGHDGHHARFNRAAALQANAAVRIAIARHGVAGSASGLLRLEPTLDLPAMRALLSTLRLPAEHVQAIDAAAATMRAGVELGSPAWFFPDGGWVDPAGLARSFLERAGAMATLRCDFRVDRIERVGDGSSAIWRLRAADGSVVDEAVTLVLANAGDALRLLGEPDWPVDSVRGQLSGFDTGAAPYPTPMPALPVAGQGYVIPVVAGKVWFGATSQPGEADPAVRRTDHVDNLTRLGRLLGREVGLEPESLLGRTAWRCVVRDRLPLIGAVPEVAAPMARDALPASTRARPPDHARHVPRLPGLYICSGFGSRGITVAALAARVLAALATGAPVALENDLLEAVDPARFVARAARRPGHDG